VCVCVCVCVYVYIYIQARALLMNKKIVILDERLAFSKVSFLLGLCGK
jgi:hypothetical protein